jgi:hypothetical protein
MKEDDEDVVAVMVLVVPWRREARSVARAVLNGPKIIYRRNYSDTRVTS